MLKVLRELNPDEMREVVALCGAHAGATPEDIVRYLARICGATWWVILPAQTPEMLLDQVGRRLGMTPMTGGPAAVPARERAILGCLLRQAWEAAEPAARRETLRRALAAWDHPTLPPPQPGGVKEASLRIALESLLQHASGCRALAAACERAPLPLPAAGWLRGAVQGALGSSASGHQALYGVLLVLWRARARLLREKREQRAHLQRQLRQLASIESVRRRSLDAAGTAWATNPVSGLSLVAAASASLAVHAALASVSAVVLLPAIAVGAGGLIWSACAAALRPGPTSDRRLMQTSAQMQSCRALLARLEGEIRELELE